MKNDTAADLAMFVLADWSADLLSIHSSSMLLNRTWDALITHGSDEQIQHACALIADALIGEGAWSFANAGEAALANNGLCAIDFCASDDRGNVEFPRFFSPENCERDDQISVVTAFCASL